MQFVFFQIIIIIHIHQSYFPQEHKQKASDPCPKEPTFQEPPVSHPQTQLRAKTRCYFKCGHHTLSSLLACPVMSSSTYLGSQHYSFLPAAANDMVWKHRTSQCQNPAAFLATQYQGRVRAWAQEMNVAKYSRFSCIWVVLNWGEDTSVRPKVSEQNVGSEEGLLPSMQRCCPLFFHSPETAFAEKRRDSVLAYSRTLKIFLFPRSRGVEGRTQGSCHPDG